MNGQFYRFFNTTREDLIERLKKTCDVSSPSEEVRVIASHLSFETDSRPGAQWVLWRVIETSEEMTHLPVLDAIGHKPRYLTCTLIDEGVNGCRYTEIPEMAYPLHFSCPEALLDLATDGVNKDWRRNVRNYHNFAA